MEYLKAFAYGHRGTLCCSPVYGPGISRTQILSFFPRTCIAPSEMEPKRLVERWQRKSLKAQTASLNLY